MYKCPCGHVYTWTCVHVDLCTRGHVDMCTSVSYTHLRAKHPGRGSFGRLVLALPTTPAAWQAFWTSRVGPFDRLANGGWHVARGRRFFLPLRHRLHRRSLPPLHPTSGRLRVASCTQCAANSLTPPTSKQARLSFPPRGGVEHCRRFQGLSLLHISEPTRPY